MSQPDFREEDQKEAPLDPAAERVQARLKRLLFGSTLIMFAGLVAVFAAILYKINTNESGVPSDAFASTVVIGPDAEVLQVTFAESIMLVLVREGSKTALLRIDPLSGKQIGRTEFVAR